MATKLVHIFDEVTHEFKGIWHAQESPLEPGTFIEPVHSCADAPTVAPAGSVSVRDTANTSWSVVTDNRGATIYDQTTGASVECSTIAVPAGYALTPPPKTPAQLSAEKSAMLNRARVLREQVLSRLNGIHLDAMYAGDPATMIPSIMVAKQALLDITIHPPVVAAVTADETKIAVLTRYYEIAATLQLSAPAAVTAFVNLDM